MVQHVVQLRRIRGSTRYVLWQVREGGFPVFCGIDCKRGDRIRQGMKKNEEDESCPRLATFRHLGIASVQRRTLPEKKQLPRTHNLDRAAPTFVILMILPCLTRRLVFTCFYASVGIMQPTFRFRSFLQGKNCVIIVSF